MAWQMQRELGLPEGQNGNASVYTGSQADEVQGMIMVSKDFSNKRDGVKSRMIRFDQFATPILAPRSFCGPSGAEMNGSEITPLTVQTQLNRNHLPV